MLFKHKNGFEEEKIHPFPAQSQLILPFLERFPSFYTPRLFPARINPHPTNTRPNTKNNLGSIVPSPVFGVSSSTRPPEEEDVLEDAAVLPVLLTDALLPPEPLLTLTELLPVEAAPEALAPEEAGAPEALPPFPLFEAFEFPELLPAPEDSPKSTDTLPTSSLESELAPELLLLPELLPESSKSPTSAVVLPAADEEELLSSSLSEEPPSKLENTIPAEAANDSAAELLYPVITSGDHPDWDPIDVTDFGIVMELIPLPDNAPLSIVVSPLGNDMELTLLQPASAPLPIIFVPE